MRKPTSVPTHPVALWPFEAWVALIAVYTGSAHFLPLPSSGTSRVIDAIFPQLVGFWSVLYFAGGVAVLVGLSLRSVRFESLGLHLLGSGVTVSLLAMLVANAPVMPTLVTNGGAAVACGIRLYALRSLQR